MLLECPNCSTCFRVSPQMLGEIGRTARCSRCIFEWFAEPRDLREGRRPTRHPQEPTETETSATEESAPTEFGEDVPSAPDSMSMEAETPSALAAPQKKPPLFPAIAALAAAAVFFAVCGLLYFHEPLRHMGLGGFYDAVGMEQAEGMKLANLSLTRAAARRATCIIQGSVVNTTDKAQSAPVMRIRLVDEGGEMLSEWEYEQKGVIKANAVLPFSADTLDCAFLQTAHAFVIDIGVSFDLALRD